MPTEKVKRQGIVAILDALGASSFADLEIKQFLDARKQALDSLDQELQKLHGMDRVDEDQTKYFTFNDTVLLTFRAKEGHVKDKEILAFFLPLRKFFIDSLNRGILFRGAISIGEFFVDDDSNTILGPAVTDAAAWYDKADWLGLLLTPRASLEILFRQEIDLSEPHFACVDYDVPMRQGQKIKLKVLQWQSPLAATEMKKGLKGQKPRAWFLKCLSDHKIPPGTEAKYTNSLAFFDYCEKLDHDLTNLGDR